MKLRRSEAEHIKKVIFTLIVLIILMRGKTAGQGVVEVLADLIKIAKSGILRSIYAHLDQLVSCGFTKLQLFYRMYGCAFVASDTDLVLAPIDEFDTIGRHTLCQTSKK